jgi:hypothetical protein
MAKEGFNSDVYALAAKCNDSCSCCNDSVNRLTDPANGSSASIVGDQTNNSDAKPNIGFGSMCAKFSFEKNIAATPTICETVFQGASIVRDVCYATTPTFQASTVVSAEEKGKLDAELNRISDDEKKEYLDAMRFTPSSVIETEANPIMFILVEEYRYDKAARRMIDYWKNRKIIFGDRAYRSIFDLSGNGAMSTDDVMPFKRALENMILPTDKAGRTVLYFDDELVDVSYCRDIYADKRQRILFYLLNFVASTNIPISQREGFISIRVIRRADYDLTKALKHCTVTACMPVVSHSIHFCGIPPKGARRHFEERLAPLLLGVGGHRDEACIRDKAPRGVGHNAFEGKPSALSVFPVRVLFHLPSKHQNLVSKLEAYGFESRRLPLALGGTWSSTICHGTEMNFLAPTPVKQAKKRHNEATDNSTTLATSKRIQSREILLLHNTKQLDTTTTEPLSKCSEVHSPNSDSRSDYSSPEMEQNGSDVQAASKLNHVKTSQGQLSCVDGDGFLFRKASVHELTSVVEEKPNRELQSSPSPSFGFKCLSKEANEAIVQQRILRKRQMDVVYARHRRRREKCQETILQEQVASMTRSNKELYKEHSMLTAMLSDARTQVSRIELELSMMQHPLRLNSNVPYNDEYTATEALADGICRNANISEVLGAISRTPGGFDIPWESRCDPSLLPHSRSSMRQHINLPIPQLSRVEDQLMHVMAQNRWLQHQELSLSSQAQGSLVDAISLQHQMQQQARNELNSQGLYCRLPSTADFNMPDDASFNQCLRDLQQMYNSGLVFPSMMRRQEQLLTLSPSLMSEFIYPVVPPMYPSVTMPNNSQLLSQREQETNLVLFEHLRLLELRRRV